LTFGFWRTGDLISGKFRVPLLAGEVDSNIEKYSEMEEAISGSLSHWAGNLYVAIFPLCNFVTLHPGISKPPPRRDSLETKRNPRLSCNTAASC
jgi:hypothetical protein